MNTPCAPYATLELARRLERTEGQACAEFANARSRVSPQSGAAWMDVAGTYAGFDGPESPVTQTFGLGMFEQATPATLDALEQFFRDRGAPVFHEVSPLAGVETFDLLCRRGYRPVELSNVLYRAVDEPDAETNAGVEVRIADADEAVLWSEISARGWAHEHPELRDFVFDLGNVFAARKSSVSFLAELDGRPGATGMLSIHDGVALLGGAATVPEFRRRGLQSALLRARLRYAADHGCDIAMMAALPGSDSQRNAERRGFRIAYTRTKWKLE
jgi:GNAT superfamily N-acetyltransferase